MKKSTLIFLLFFMSNNISAQKYSISFNYSGMITSKNYKSVSLYTLGSDYEVMNNTLSLGVSASVVDARVNKTFINNPSSVNPYESSIKVGVKSKYYQSLLRNDSFNIKVFTGIELGMYLTSRQKTYLNTTIVCEELYRFDVPNDFYTNFSIGSIFFPEDVLSFILELQYQIRNSKIKYEKPNCFDGVLDSYSEYTEQVNLNIFLWSVGFKINF